LPDLLENIDAVHSRQIHVQQNEIRRSLFEKGQTLAALLWRGFPANPFLRRVFLACGAFFSHGSKAACVRHVFLDELTIWRILHNRFIYLSETP
jgi:hypothetical protein